jgi:Ni,Fe-hydrogenase III large subunit
MEPVILLIGIAAIISITRIKLKTIQLERERLQLGQPTVAGRADSLKKSDTQLILQEIQQLNKRIENLETIVVSEDLALQQHNDTAEIRKQMALLAKKVEEIQTSKSI